MKISAATMPMNPAAISSMKSMNQFIGPRGARDGVAPGAAAPAAGSTICAPPTDADGRSRQ